MRVGVVTFPGSLDDRDALRAVVTAGGEGVAQLAAMPDPVGQVTLRRELDRGARAKLVEAHVIEPGNPYVANNLHLLNESAHSGKAIE